jgi:hypothetical protein
LTIAVPRERGVTFSDKDFDRLLLTGAMTAQSLERPQPGFQENADHLREHQKTHVKATNTTGLGVKRSWVQIPADRRCSTDGPSKERRL